MLSAVWENPIFVRYRQVDRRARGGGMKAFVSRFGSGLVILLGPIVLCCCIFTFNSVEFASSVWMRENLAPALAVSAFLMVLYVIGRATNGTFNAITVEREQMTYDTLLATRLTAREMVVGKLATGLWPVLRELALVAPLGVALGWLVGYGRAAMLFVLLCLVCAAFFGQLGLLTSFSAGTTQRAHRKVTALVGMLLLGGPLLDWFLNCLATNQAYIPMATYLSPLAAAVTIGPAGPHFCTVTVVAYSLGSALIWRPLIRRAGQGRLP